MFFNGPNFVLVELINVQRQMKICGKVRKQKREEDGKWNCANYWD